MKNSTFFVLLFISFVFFSCNTTQKQEPENNDFSYLDNSSEAKVNHTDDNEQPVEQTISCESSRVELIGILLQKNRVVLTDNVRASVLVTIISLNKPVSITCNNGKNIEIKEVAIHTHQNIDGLIGSTVFAIGDVKYDSLTDITKSRIADAEVVRIETLKGSEVTSF
ncbi:MAG: hypothetical protein M9887_08900 [Chitinophagales bacterium]|nr:hypothetical protein [Chitinophagales bacterium]